MPPLVTVQTLVVDEVKATVRPDVDEAPPLRTDKFGDVPKFCVPGFTNVMVCEPLGVTLLEAADGAPVNEAALVAVTVKV